MLILVELCDVDAVVVEVHGDVLWLGRAWPDVHPWGISRRSPSSVTIPSAWTLGSNDRFEQCDVDPVGGLIGGQTERAGSDADWLELGVGRTVYDVDEPLLRIRDVNPVGPRVRRDVDWSRTAAKGWWPPSGGRCRQSLTGKGSRARFAANSCFRTVVVRVVTRPVASSIRWRRTHLVKPLARYQRRKACPARTPSVGR